MNSVLKAGGKQSLVSGELWTLSEVSSEHPDVSWSFYLGGGYTHRSCAVCLAGYSLPPWGHLVSALVLPSRFCWCECASERCEAGWGVGSTAKRV